jgi:hypothetical protein
MTAVISLGTFERVSLKDAWPTEDGNFTPWLAQADIIKLLGEALNMERGRNAPRARSVAHLHVRANPTIAVPYRSAARPVALRFDQVDGHGLE